MRFFRLRIGAAALAACALGIAVLAQSGGHGFDTSRMDTTVAACNDFYQFANGNWLKTTQIPAAFPSWGSFNVLNENNRNTLHEILEEAAKNATAKAGSVEQKIGDFYATCMDEQKREAEGAKPLAPYLARINKVKDVKGVESEVAYFHKEGIPVLFGFGSGPSVFSFDFGGSVDLGGSASLAGGAWPGASLASHQTVDSTA